MRPTVKKPDSPVFEVLILYPKGRAAYAVYHIRRIQKSANHGHEVVAECWSPYDAKIICRAFNAAAGYDEQD